VPLSHPLHTYFVQAATKRWLTGQGNCYGISDPCFAVPDQPINRAEMAALLIRAFALQAESNAPKFDDVPPDAWYALYIQNASSMCILQGDDNANTVRPADTINRAEMVVMLKRAGAALQYPDCEASEFSGGSRWPVREEEGVRSIEGFQDPYGLDMIDGMLYVSDGGRGQVLRFTEDLQYRGWLGMLDGNPNGWHDTGDPTRSPVAGALDFPHSVTQLDNGTLLVADYTAKTIRTYTSNGTFIGNFYDPQDTDLAFRGPPTIDIDSAGIVWVADYAGHRIMKFDQDGNLLGWKGERTDGTVVENFTMQGVAQSSNAYGGFRYPHQIAVEQNGTFYVADMDNHRLQKFAKDGTFLGWLGARADGSITSGWTTEGVSAASATAGGFNRPISVTLTPKGNLLVTDSLNHRIQLLTTEGAFIRQQGGFDRTINSIVHNGKLYVADSSGRIQIFTLKNEEE